MENQKMLGKSCLNPGFSQIFCMKGAEEYGSGSRGTGELVLQQASYQLTLAFMETYSGAHDLFNLQDILWQTFSY